MVNYSMLTSFYDELIKEISITCVPVRMNYKRWLSFEQVAKKMILDTYQSQESLPGVLFPCVRQRPSDELCMGRITSLQFVLLFHFHVEQLDHCRELSTRLFGRTSQSSKINIPPVNGFPFTCIADDRIDNSGVWLGRRLQCYDDNGNLICTLLLTCVEQLLLKRQGESNIWNTPPFSSAIMSKQTNYYFHDQFRKNAYWGGDSEEAYQIFLPTVIQPEIFLGSVGSEACLFEV